MSHSSQLITRPTFALILLVMAGCAPSEPAAPAPKAAPTEAPAEIQEAPPAEPKEEQPVEPAEPQAAITPEDSPIEVGPQLVPPANTPVARAGESEPKSRTTFYRGDSGPAKIPAVELSNAHETLCRVKVGDALPQIELPRIGDSRDRASLADLAGEKATVVVFWTADRRMAREQLADLSGDVVAQFGDSGVAVVGIAVNESGERAEEVLQQAKARFPNLLDSNGEAFAKVGSERLPRTYLVDSDGKILWFDIEYSLSTRRELNRALRALTESN